MALYGEEMVDVTTPDGRRISVPAQLAANFPALQPSAPPPQQQPAPIAPPAPEPQLPAQSAPILPPPADAQAAPPASSPAPVVEAPPPKSPANTAQPQTAPAPQQGAKPVTNKDLRTLGNAGAFNVASQALEEQGAAVRQQAQVEADQATAVGNAMEARNAETDRILKERADAAAKQQAALDAKMAEYERDAKAIADTKIARSLDHPVLSMIALALSAAGEALGGPSAAPTIDMLIKSVDRKAQAQQQALDNRKGALAVKRDAMGLLRERGKDRLAEYDTLRVAALDQAAQQIETIKTRSQSPRAQANADAAIAALKGERAKTLDGAIAREQTKQQNEISNAMQARGLANADRAYNRGVLESDRAFGENVRQFNVKEANDLEAARQKALAEGNKTKADLIDKTLKMNQDGAVGDPGSGKYILQPSAKPIIEQIKRHESNIEKLKAAGSKEQDPGKRDAIGRRIDAEQRAKDDAQLTVDREHTWRVASGAHTKIATQIGATQTIASLADEITALREKEGPKWYTTNEGQAFMQSKGAALSLALKDAAGLGVLSAQDFKLIDEATGGDPTKWTPGDISNLLGNEGTAARLRSLSGSMIAKATNDARILGLQGDLSFRRDTPVDPKARTALKQLKGESSVERSEAATKPGPIQRGVDATLGRVTDVGGVAGTEQTPDFASYRADQELGDGSTKYTGFTKSQEKGFDSILSDYRAGAGSADSKAASRSADAAKALVEAATTANRPSYAQAALNALKTAAPDLYQQALNALPAEDPTGAAPRVKPGDVTAGAIQSAPQPALNRADMARNEQMIMTAQPTPLLADLAIGGDVKAKQELVKRVAEGDKEAVKAVQFVIRSIGQRQKFAPGGTPVQ